MTQTAFWKARSARSTQCALGLVEGASAEPHTSHAASHAPANVAPGANREQSPLVAASHASHMGRPYAASAALTHALGRGVGATGAREAVGESEGTYHVGLGDGAYDGAGTVGKYDGTGEGKGNGPSDKNDGASDGAYVLTAAIDGAIDGAYDRVPWIDGAIDGAPFFDLECVSRACRRFRCFLRLLRARRI